MATVCSACGTENRDKARYCRGCARPLAAAPGPEPTDGHAAEAAAAARRARRERRQAAHQRRSGWRRGRVAVVLGALTLATLVLAGLAFGWFDAVPVASDTPSPTMPTPAPPAVQVAPAPDPVPTPADTPLPPAQAVGTALSPAPAPVVDPVAAPPAPARPPQPRPAPTRQNAAPTKPPPVATPVAPRNEAIATPPPQEVRAMPAATPAAPRSVDQICADRTNFLTRDICRIQACGDPSQAGDPVCVRFREMEQANRNRTRD